MRISTEILDKCQTIDEVLDVKTDNGKINYSSLGNNGQDYSNFHYRYNFLKNRIKVGLPEWSIQEVLEFENKLEQYRKVIDDFQDSYEYLQILEFEHEKKLL